MFLDSDSNTDISSFGDENFSNHPGFIGGTWFKDLTQPGKAESERYDDEVKKQKGNCDYAAGDSCADLLDCKQYFQGIYNSNTGNSRVPKRARKAASHHKGKVSTMMAARDCNVETTVTSGTDESYQAVDDKNEELALIREQLTKLGQDSSAAQESTFAQAQAMINDQATKAASEKKNLMIGAGALVAIMMIVLVLK